MQKVLLVEDSKFFGRVLRDRIQSQLNVSIEWYETYREAAAIVKTDPNRFFAALLDLKLPDAMDGEIVDLVLSYEIPSIVFTGDFSDNLRDQMWSRKVVDYVLKEGNYNFDYIVRLIRRIQRNRHVKVLIVDDSRVFRRHLRNILQVHQFKLFEASSGGEALELLQKHPDVRLLLTDYNMPDMNGAELTKQVRSTHSSHEMAIIGLSAHGDHLLSARFIKSGANDFIHKPFVNEEFYCRISQNLDLLDYLTETRQSSLTDYLTGLYNRRFFLDTGKKLFARSQREGTNCAVGMVDIDYFKKINDTHGHDIGDMVLKHVARRLQQRFRESDVVARFGGEEFCIFTPGMRPQVAAEVFEALRLEIETDALRLDGQAIRATVSIGVCCRIGDSLEEMVKTADTLLYGAKAGGRNRIATDL